jgi:hypothetical protein
MTIAATTLIEKTRALLRDYGDLALTLGAAVTDTTGTSVTVSSADDISAGPNTFALVDNEMLGITAANAGTEVLTVIRGARGSTAATHTNGALIRINPIWGNHEILDALNQAQDAAYPLLYKLVDDTSEEITADVWEYDLPSTIDTLVRVEIETSTSDVYVVSRNWTMQDTGAVLIEDAHAQSTGRKIRMVGMGRFSAMTLTGNLDSYYPTDAIPQRYLVLAAAGYLLQERQGPMAKRDSFIGITDSWQQAQPFMSATMGRDYIKQARDLLKQCQMPRLKEYQSAAGRAYHGRA